MLETTFGVSVMEPWEKAVFCECSRAPASLVFAVASPTDSRRIYAVSLLTVLTLFVIIWLFHLLPTQLSHLQHRLAYYLFGHASGDE